ncbi:MAG TPA: FAD-binding oxidoreductase [Solirubrobacteraceae bacterium]|nr:FAD-binding oxidoreductase [Solirubrobacteraceae bacterium]
MTDGPTTEPEMSWHGWGDPAQATPLPETLHAVLRETLGVGDPRPAPRSVDRVRLAEPRLERRMALELAGIVGADGVYGDHETRLRHALGRSTPDLLALRAGTPLPAPDLVLTPDSHEQVLTVLQRCSLRRIAVVPFGGGTSVVGGLSPDADGFAGTIALDLRRLSGLHELDEESRLATLGPGLRGPEAELLLGERGYTLGHFPQSFEYATLGGFAATRSSGQASAGYGRFDDLVMALRVATPSGTLQLGRAPRSAAGPDLRQLLLGSEGALGVITSLTLAVRPAPAVRVYDGWRFATFHDGARALRMLAQDGPRPTVLRLSDEAETALNLARPGQLGAGGVQAGGCLAIVGFEGTEKAVQATRAQTERTLAEHGAEPVPDAGELWSAGRYRAPYLRDALLDAGVLVETLETACFWSSLHDLYAGVSAAVRDALSAQGTPPVIAAHISHVYPAGASLYFTVAAAQLPDPIAQWRAAKAAAGDAIVALGATITHHHGVGTDHAPWYQREIGGLAVDVLRSVKRTLDPAGILNPGVLIGAAPTAPGDPR